MSINAQNTVQITSDTYQKNDIVDVVTVQEKTKCTKIVEVYDFEEELESYLNNLTLRNYSPNTIKLYRSVLTAFIKEIYKSNVMDNKKSFNKFFTNYILRIRNTKSERYTYLITTVCIPFLKKIGINYVDNFGSIKKPKSIPHPLNEHQINLLLESVKYDERVDSVYKVETCKRNKIIILTLYATGVRVSELCNIKLSDIDFQHNQILIKGKGNKERIVLLDEATSYKIQEYLNERITQSKYLICNTKSREDRPLTTRSVQTIIRTLGKKVGFDKKVTPHIIRHSFATNLLRKGMNLKYIQELMGHDSVDTTQIYTKAELSDIQHQYNRLK